jgi:hypothetical protein
MMMITETEKRCSRCGQVKPATTEHFYFYQGKPHGYCKPCKAETNLVANRQYRTDALVAYGNKCACCGEVTTEFLGIDHIDGGGVQHRKELALQGTHLYLWLKKEGYPEGFQVLCHNCNLAKGFYGVCPHQVGI